jgi:rRNA maturation protein Rpf1
MTKSKLFIQAHQIAKTLEGDYKACLSYALKVSWAKTKGVIEMEKVIIVKNKTIGDVEVHVNQNRALATIQGQKVVLDLAKGYQKGVVYFEEHIKIKGVTKKVNGMSLSKEDFDNVKNAYDKIKSYFDKKEYEEKMQRQASYHSSYGFICINEYEHVLHHRVAKLLEEQNKKESVDWGDYSTDTTFTVTNKEVLEMLSIEKVKYEQEKEVRKQEAKKRMDELFAEAKAANKPVKISSWSEDCNDPHEECDIDIVTEYAMPNGSIKTERNHTW